MKPHSSSKSEVGMTHYWIPSYRYVVNFGILILTIPLKKLWVILFLEGSYGFWGAVFLGIPETIHGSFVLGGRFLMMVWG